MFYIRWYGNAAAWRNGVLRRAQHLAVLRIPGLYHTINFEKYLQFTVIYENLKCFWGSDRKAMYKLVYTILAYTACYMIILQIIQEKYEIKLKVLANFLKWATGIAIMAAPGPRNVHGSWSPEHVF